MTRRSSSFYDVAVFIDRLRDVPEERRLLQLLADLRALLGVDRITVVAAEGSRSTPDPLGIPVIQTDSRGWLEERRFWLTLAVLAGPASAGHVLRALRETQPQATLFGLLPSLAPVRCGLDTRFDVPEERSGSTFAEDRRRASAGALLRSLDALLVADGGHSHAACAAPGVDRYSYGVRVDATEDAPGFDARSALLSWGHFGREQGDPDEEAALAVDGRLRSLVATVAPQVDVVVVLDDAPAGLRRLHPRPGLSRADALRAARALVVARSFGDPSAVEALVAEAAEAGTPVVALAGSTTDPAAVIEAVDVADLARLAGRLGADRGAWERAAASQAAWAAERSPTRAVGELATALAAAGVAAAAPAAVPLPPPPASDVEGPRTIQGQVQTEGLAQHRPTSLAFARADIPQDHLWPHLAYEAWWDAHPLEERAQAALRRHAAQLPYQPLVSIVMPVYDTDPEVLRAAVESVLSQTYPMWELCAVDDASTSAATRAALDELATSDDRMRVQRLEVNQGIAGASNAAIEMAKGTFIALLDHDDSLSPEALFEVVTLLNEEPDLDFLYSDEDKIDLDDRRTMPFFKPSWSPHLHLGVNYVTHFAVYRKSLVGALGGFRSGFDGSQDYDLSLRATERTRRVGHIAKPIYTWRMVPGSAAVTHDAKPYAIDAAHRALTDALDRRGIAGRVERGLVPGTWRPRFDVARPPLVSILIPTRNGHALLERCINSIVQRTTYRHFEIVIVDNGSDDPETLSYLRSLDARVVLYPYRFNYARQMNLAVTVADGEQVLFLNNDIEVVTPGWLDSMVELAQQDDVGAVGARLLFPNGRPQHEGVFIGFGGGSAGNVDFGDYFGLGRMIRDATAVTAACMLMRVEAFHAVGGFDERLRVAFNDVDLCLRLRQRGYQVVYTPYAELYHAESASRGKLHPTEDEAFFVRRWGSPGAFRDPFYNPNLDPIRPFRLRR